VTEYTILCRRIGKSNAEVTVCISLHNYQNYILETLQSVAGQFWSPLDLVIVDDLSTDNSTEIAKTWIENNGCRFNNLMLVSHARNSGLSITRNTGFFLAETEYVFVLDADNLLYPRCIGRCLQAIKSAKSDFAYCIIERFETETGEPCTLSPLMGVEGWSQKRLVYGNYIDAMALVRKQAWKQVGGYRVMRHGWEDYDFWCKFAEHNLQGAHIPEILCRYRVHSSSMLSSITRKNMSILRSDMMKHHPWLRL